MTDLLTVLPAFSTVSFSHILPSLERNFVTTVDLLLLDPTDIAKRAQVPTREVRRLTETVLQALHQQSERRSYTKGGTGVSLRSTGLDLVDQWQSICCLEDYDSPERDSIRISAGYVTEVTGESGSGKTQFLLSLLLAVQLGPPHGLGRAALYISTEAALQTTRLEQILASHPFLKGFPDDVRPSLKRVLSIQTQDVESQEHILRYQLPVAVRRHGIGLVVIDSITANFRAEIDRHGTATSGNAMAKRSAQLLELGSLLRDLARTENLAVVVANQVGDRFGLQASEHGEPIPSGNSVGSTHQDLEDLRLEQQADDLPQEATSLDHQQRWFTGWGDGAPRGFDTHNQKTPSLGVVWTNQLGTRIALTKSTRTSAARAHRPTEGGREWDRGRKIVFSASIRESDHLQGGSFEVEQSGIVLSKKNIEQSK